MTDEKNPFDGNLHKVPPQNLAAESSILGTILQIGVTEPESLNHTIESIKETIKPDDFYRDSHRKIFQAMIELTDRGNPVDLITLSDFLKNRGDLDAVGGSAYLASLADSVPTAVNVSYYASIVREKSISRRLINLTTGIASRLYEEQDNVEELLEQAEKSIADIKNSAGGSEEIKRKPVTISISEVEREE